SVGFGIGTLIVILMTLLSWFLGTWAHFLWVTRFVPVKVEVFRETRTPGGPTTVLWARQPATVHVEIRWAAGGTLPFVLAIDKAPGLARWSEGESWARGPLSREVPLVIDYPIDCPAAGRLRFDGVKLIVTDLQGFFHRTVFLRQRAIVRVLPPLVEGPGG